jgi:hypothetical protein
VQVPGVIPEFMPVCRSPPRTTVTHALVKEVRLCVPSTAQSLLVDFLLLLLPHHHTSPRTAFSIRATAARGAVSFLMCWVPSNERRDVWQGGDMTEDAV